MVERFRRPNCVRINGRDWHITYRPLKDLCGQTLYGKGRIEIATRMPEFDVRDTVVHEIMHAVLHQQGREGGGNEVEEAYVGPLATGLVGVLQDNPELASWLIAPIARRA